MQKDMKKLIAYSSVSHLGFCTLGIFALTPHGLAGSVLQQVNHGISTGALFLIVGILYERRHTRMVADFGGLSTPMPNFAAIYLIISLSSLGMPLLNGFIGEFTILRGVFEVDKMWAVWGVIGIVLGAAYLLWLYQRVMFGAVTNPANERLPDLNAREFATLVPLVVLAFWIGVYPKPFFRILDPPVRQIVERVNPGYYLAQRASGLSADVRRVQGAGSTVQADTNVPPAPLQEETTAKVRSINDADFPEEVIVASNTQLVMVEFWAEWVAPARMLAPTVKQIARDYAGKLKVVKLNVDENPASPAKYDVREIPTLIVFKDGQVADRIVGAVPKEKIAAVLEQNLK